MTFTLVPPDEQFLSPEERLKIEAAVAEYCRRKRLTLDKEDVARAIEWAAIIRTNALILENVLDGYLLFKVDPDGDIQLSVTETGAALVKNGSEKKEKKARATRKKSLTATSMEA